MVNPTTPNLGLEQPLRGSEVGTWDVPVNSNTGIIDNALGGVTTIALSSVSVTLTASQAQASVIRLTGTLNNSVVAVVLPSSIYKGWTVDNQITNSPSSLAVLFTSSAGTFSLGIAPGVNDIFYDGSTIQYRNMGRVGEYWDYAGGQVPTWVAICTKQPWLNCNGTTFSSATYPVLANLLGTNTLPDSRGGARVALNQGTGRLSSANGVDGNTIFSRGGTDSITLASSQMPVHNHNITDLGHVHAEQASQAGGINQITLAAGSGIIQLGGVNTALAFTGITINNTGGGGSHSNVQPTYVGGITMIRAA